jgi:hypothetical protein
MFFKIIKMITYNGLNRVELLRKIGTEFLFGKGAEIGTFKGQFSKQILNNWSGTLYMIDVWRPLGDEYLDASNHAEHLDAYSETMKNIEGLESRAIMIRADSEIASDMFSNESLDFVYIDANHAYDYVVQDINLWYPKVKKGGYMWGHDYIAMDWYKDPNFAENKKDKYIWSNNNFYHGVFGVNPAVDEFCKKYNYDLTVTSEWFGSWLIKK